MVKKFYMLLVLVLSFMAGCNNNKTDVNTLERNVQKYIKNEYRDIVSLKTLSLELVDSISMLQTVKMEKLRLDSFISYSENQVSAMDKKTNYLKSTSNAGDEMDYATDNKQFYEVEIEKNTEMADYLDKVRKATDIKSPCAYQYLYKVEAKMKSKELAYINFLVLADYKDSVLQVTRNPEKVEPVPCKIPGYDDKYDAVTKKYSE